MATHEEKSTFIKDKYVPFVVEHVLDSSLESELTKEGIKLSKENLRVLRQIFIDFSDELVKNVLNIYKTI